MLRGALVLGVVLLLQACGRTPFGERLLPCVGSGSWVTVDTLVGKASRVFVTSRLYGADLAGLEGADGACQDSADAALLAGEWRAWIGDDSASPAARLAHAKHPFVRLDGVTVADDWMDLTDGTLMSPINITERCEQLGVVTSEVWTNSLSDGAQRTQEGACGNWHDASADAPFAGVGLTSASDGRWSFAYQQFCDRTNVRLYCFEQP